MISIIASIIFFFLDIFLFRLYFKIIFGNIKSLQKSVKYSVTPDLYSLMKGKYVKDKLSEFKIGMFIGLIILTIVFEISIIAQL